MIIVGAQLCLAFLQVALLVWIRHRTRLLEAASADLQQKLDRIVETLVRPG